MACTLSSKLLGTGGAVPGAIIPNRHFEAKLDTTDEWIRTRTGIVERRHVSPIETTVTLGLEASRRALDAANCRVDEIDLITCATVTPEHLCPSTACTIAANLGCRSVAAFVLSAACSGFIYALSVADQFIRSGTASKVLVVGSDTLSRAVDFGDRNTCILFGDAAGAAVVGAAPISAAGIHNIALYSDGTQGGLITLPGPCHAD